ncbi:MAG: DUF2914 domain-containing protein [Ferrovibrio sp.]|nr:DUF2914 domain-containing protein [Ferrovibrio sp.]
MLRLLPFFAIPCLFAWPILAQAQTAVPAEHDCVVRQFVTARQVNNLEPQGEVERYEAGTERGYAFARLDCTNVGSGETFYFRWMQGDREVAKSRARVDVSRNWRIWSQIRLSPGEWVVQLQDSAGRVQAERKFSVAAPAATE